MSGALSLGIGLSLIPRGLPVFGPADTTPDAFTFTDVTGATTSTVYQSNILTITGLTAAAVISISGGSGQYSKNGGAYTSTPGLISNGDTVRARVTSSAASATAVSTTVTIGGVSDTYSVTTGGGAGGTLDFSDPNNSALIV